MRSLIIILAVCLAPLAANADTIIGCVHQKSGKLRLVADAGQCKAGKEAVVTWSSEGPPGPQGEQGPPGEEGTTSPRFEFVGFSTATRDGDDGFFGMNLACQADLPGSRMCTSVEVIETIDIPTGLTGEAWVRPVLQPSGDSWAVDSVSGVYALITNLTCRGFSSSQGGYTGLIVKPDGAFGDGSCLVYRPVACCAPTD